MAPCTTTNATVNTLLLTIGTFVKFAVKLLAGVVWYHIAAVEKSCTTVPVALILVSNTSDICCRLLVPVTVIDPNVDKFAFTMFAFTVPPTPKPPVTTNAPLFDAELAVALVTVVTPFDVKVVNAPELLLVEPIGVDSMLVPLIVPEDDMLPEDDILPEEKVPPTFKFFAIPTPPATITAPLFELSLSSVLRNVVAFGTLPPVNNKSSGLPHIGGKLLP